MPSRQTARTSSYAEQNPVRDARSRIEALFGAPSTDYLVQRSPDEMALWQKRPLEPAYAMVFIDSLALRTRERGLLNATRLHFALGILDDGTKDIVGVWAEHPHAVSFWPAAVSQLRARGVAKIGMAVAEDDAAVRALSAGFPSARVVRSIKRFAEVSTDHLPLPVRREAVAARLRYIVDGPGAADDLASSAAQKQTAAARFWRENQELAHPILTTPPGVRDVVCTTTAVDSIVEKLRRRGLSKRTNYSTTEAAIRELAFVLRDASASWKIAQRKWAPVRQYLQSSD
jgi:transposase-like protein